GPAGRMGPVASIPPLRSLLTVHRDRTGLGPIRRKNSMSYSRRWECRGGPRDRRIRERAAAGEPGRFPDPGFGSGLAQPALEDVPRRVLRQLCDELHPFGHLATGPPSLD